MLPFAEWASVSEWLTVETVDRTSVGELSTLHLDASQLCCVTNARLEQTIWHVAETPTPSHPSKGHYNVQKNRE
jgi:hypothetical protein